MTLCAAIVMVGCQSSDDQDITMNQLTFGDDQTVIYQLLNASVELTPTFSETDSNVTLSWYVDSQYVGDGASYTYIGQRIGTSTVSVVAVSDSYDAATRDYTIVTQRQMSFSSDNKTSLRYAPGSSVVVTPSIDNLPSNATYSWLEDGDEISTSTTYSFLSDEDVERNLLLTVSAEGMSSISAIYNVVIAATYINPEIFLDPSSLAASASASNDGGANSDAWDLADGYSYLYNTGANAGWGSIVSEYLKRADGRKAFKYSVAQDGHFTWDSSSVATLMCALYSEEYSSSVASPEYINDGEERYFNFSVAFQTLIPTQGATTMVRAYQTQATENAGENLPMIEFGWDDNSKFGLWARSGSTGASGDSSLATHLLEVDAMTSLESWYDIIIGYKFSPESSDGWIKVWMKAASETTFKEYTLENIQVGYSKAATSLETIEFGYSGVAQTLATFSYFDYVSYTYYWTNQFPN